MWVRRHSYRTMSVKESSDWTRAKSKLAEVMGFGFRSQAVLGGAEFAESPTTLERTIQGLYEPPQVAQADTQVWVTANLEVGASRIDGPSIHTTREKVTWS